MPEISRFYGIVVRMYWDDHSPPRYAGNEAVIDIRNRAVLAGSLPARALGLLTEWATLHREELLSLWEKAKRLEPLGKIAPLP